MRPPPIQIHTASGSMIDAHVDDVTFGRRGEQREVHVVDHVVRTEGVPIAFRSFGNWRSDGA